jgi:outer membrane murein-binding lipoprotein Lpp
MKTRITFIASLLVTILMFSGCQSEDKQQGAMFQEEVKTIQQIEERSADISNAEEAFVLMRELNQNMKDIRDQILSMEQKYRKASESEKQKLKSEFQQANTQIDQSLKVISGNIEPYKEDKRVSKMLDKLNEIMISK